MIKGQCTNLTDNTYPVYNIITLMSTVKLTRIQIFK